MLVPHPLRLRRAPDSVDVRGSELADHCRVSVVEEQRFTGVHRGDASHLVIGQLEVEDVDVLAHALWPDRPGDDDHIALGQFNVTAGIVIVVTGFSSLAPATPSR